MGNPISMNAVLENAFTTGSEMIDSQASHGYTFTVYTNGGHTFVGCPENYCHDGLLRLDFLTDNPLLIEQSHIIAIRVDAC